MGRHVKRAKPESLTSEASRPVGVGRGAKKTSLEKVKLIVIGTSTGGPVALQKVLIPLPAQFPIPIVIIQHMPGTFTHAFAERLNQLCQIQVKEAKNGDTLRPGHALLAPGGMQLMLDHAQQGSVKVIAGDDRLNYKPCIDIAFASAAKHFPGKTLAIVLTGMGSDGCEGAKILKATGAPIWAQDEQSSVIYGMPMAVAKANVVDEVLSLSNVAKRLIEEVG